MLYDAEVELFFTQVKGKKIRFSAWDNNKDILVMYFIPESIKINPSFGTPEFLKGSTYYLYPGKQPEIFKDDVWYIENGFKENEEGFNWKYFNLPFKVKNRISIKIKKSI